MQITAKRPSFFRRHALFLTLAFSVAIFLSVYIAILYHEKIPSKAPAQETVANDDAQANAADEYRARLNNARQIEARATSAMPDYAPSCTPVADPTAVTVIVNKTYCFSPIDWAPSDLTTTSDGWTLRAVAADSYNKMKQAAAYENMNFDPTSAFRSYGNQVSMYNHWVAVNGSANAADLVSARPGYSDHQTGLAVDLKSDSCVLECFGTTAAYSWLKIHAADYGFIQRYPENLTSLTGYAAEAWHWRYVGADVAKELKKLDIKTLEIYQQFQSAHQ